MLHGLFFGRTAPSAQERRRITVPALVVGHPLDPMHSLADAAMVADELPKAHAGAGPSLLEWRFAPERLDRAAVALATRCWKTPRRGRRTGA